VEIQAGVDAEVEHGLLGRASSDSRRAARAVRARPSRPARVRVVRASAPSPADGSVTEPALRPQPDVRSETVAALALAPLLLDPIANLIHESAEEDHAR